MKFSSFLQLHLSAASLMGLEASISDSSRLLQSGSDIMIEDFAPLPDTTGTLFWRVINDPVMGGQSKSEIRYAEDDSGKVFQWTGEVDDVSFLNAPGFIKLEGLGDFQDVSSCEAIKLVVKSTTTDYKGFRLEFGTRHDPASDMQYIEGYKAQFFLENTPEFQEVIVPFHDFTVDWDPYTGDPIETCEQNPDYCPDAATLVDMEKFSIMGEGVDGEVDLEIKSISATMCEEGKNWEKGSTPKEDTSQTLPEPDDDDITIEDFAQGQLFWRTVNDPVMGGKSKSDMHYLENNGGTLFQWEGEVDVVASLNGPGFAKLEGSGDIPDVSSCKAIKMILKSTKADYKGYRLEFGTRHDPAANFESIGGYKAHFYLENTEEFQVVVVPFHDFTVDWDPFTGDAIETCEQNPDYCPDTNTLISMEKIALMGEGVEGEFDLEIKGIYATMCEENDEGPLIPPSEDTSSSQTLDDDDILMEDFSPAKYYWKVVNDPVMGGKSTSRTSYNDINGRSFYKWEGEVNNVPSLNAPGFIKLEGSGDFPDVSSCQGIKIIVKSTTTDYQGYRLELGTRHDPASEMEFIRGYKAHFFLENTADFQTVVVPFHDFTVDWDPYTGDPLVTCEQNPDYCPDIDTLISMEEFAIMGEGADGKIDLELKSIAATMCGEKYTTSSSFTPASSKDSTPLSQASEDSSTSSFGGFVIFACVLFAVAGVAYKYNQKRKQMQAYQAVRGAAMNTAEGAVYHELEMS